MRESFYMRRFHLYLGLFGTLFAIAGTLFGLYYCVIAPATNVWQKLLALGIVSMFFLLIGGSSILLVVGYRDHELTIREGHVTYTGVFAQKEITLPEVNQAHWMASSRHLFELLWELIISTGLLSRRAASAGRTLGRGFGMDSGCIVVKNGTASMTIDFGNYTAPERRRLIQFFRAGIDPAVQNDWNQFKQRYHYED